MFAWDSGAGTKVLLEGSGQSPGRVAGVTPWWLLPAVAAGSFRNSAVLHSPAPLERGARACTVSGKNKVL